jgi:double-stranded uracil-DNA glycosylase
VNGRPRPSRNDLLAAATRTVPDVIAPGLSVLFCGINPGLYSAYTGHHFARPGNRFWPALYRAGIVDRLIDASRGLAPADADLLVAKGVGITNIVNVATARADELTGDELREGARRLEALVRTAGPRVVGVLGLTAYRQAFGRPKAVAGRQPEDLGGAELWIAPNPSGLNAHASLHSLAADYRELAVRAGVPVGPPMP